LTSACGREPGILEAKLAFEIQVRQKNPLALATSAAVGAFGVHLDAASFRADHCGLCRLVLNGLEPSSNELPFTLKAWTLKLPGKTKQLIKCAISELHEVMSCCVCVCSAERSMPLGFIFSLFRGNKSIQIWEVGSTFFFNRF
jgi:hypothetical protein